LISLEAQSAGEATRLLVVGDRIEHARLDQFVAAALAPAHSRSQVGRMIKAGLISVNGMPVRASYAVHPGDRIEISSYAGGHAPVPQNATVQSLTLDLDTVEVLYGDPDLLVINKLAGMTVHPSPGHPDSTLVDVLLARFPELATMVEPDGPARAGIVHRLDKETSGVMVVARTQFARMMLSQQFKDRCVTKVYLAIVRGIVTRDRFALDRPIGRHPTERKRMSIRSHKLRPALTEFMVLHRFTQSAEPATLLKVRPLTGRTHQIRVHLAAAGYPCLGDMLYGGKSNSGWSRGGQALHALALRIAHPRSGEKMEFIAPLPDDFSVFLMANGVSPGTSSIRQWIEAV
jgi:23S rRNA pseudouridine1911/1915/1917 synthase